ncbi:hypothetical protein EYF80_027750 [Liparis tanakae]|uniref:Uncharacterized protein n=1 Tax=Liparis tanakae TaxID=230148 RepID=A0A4Z2HB58_9TELE|nr:hypothetical protein EYF80_027750 [Liparis tanakae]
MTSTTSPLCSSTYCSVLGGNISRPLALRMDMSLLETWFPGQGLLVMPGLSGGLASQVSLGATTSSREGPVSLKL